MRIRRQSLFVTMFVAASAAMMQAKQQLLLTGQAAFTDWNQQKPGVRHKITVADLPAPNDAEAVSNSPRLIPKPANAWPTAPPGFKVTLFAGDLHRARQFRVRPLHRGLRRLLEQAAHERNLREGREQRPEIATALDPREYEQDPEDQQDGEDRYDHESGRAGSEREIRSGAAVFAGRCAACGCAGRRPRSG